ncbi:MULTISPECIES: DUF4391 domain-containing protein [unclassified Roseitalea]|uniref:DUF4391 domain-containing protein n=1 Tax=unclassified Roseitalea TaxID=2639107 RepID=UPI00273DACB8|nr:MULTISPECIES: DUF4391 domain-containing protein [unclassified Roseitalea]
MTDIRTIEQFHENLAVPEACVLGKRLFKKQFYEHGQLGATDKKAFVEDIEGIEWRYTIKPSTINIPKLEDDTHEYLEIAILQVVLTAADRHQRIASVIQKAIPYPLLILFVSGTRLAVNAADKRINRADANKIVTENSYDTGWIDIGSPEPAQAAFVADFRVTNFSYRNLYDFYQDAVARIIALNCAAYTGRYAQQGEAESASKGKTARLEALRQIEKFHQERNELRNKLKKEKNLGSQVSLNTRIKQLSDRIEAARNEL